ncbi:MAG TPA: hypothetical protein VF519_03245 [Mycobacteriales bacterium]
MLRKAGKVLVATVAFSASMAGVGLAADPVGTVENALGVKTHDVVDVGPVVVGPVDGGGVIAAPTRGRSAVVGYIRITALSAVNNGAPSYTLSGALADGNQWSCSASNGVSAYRVTCLPVPLVLPVAYTCDVLHADVATSSESGSGQTHLDCDGDGNAEAQTNHVTGAGGWDNEWAVAQTPVSAFVCTLDLLRPDVTGGCGDPGLVGVE